MGKFTQNGYGIKWVMILQICMIWLIAEPNFNYLGDQDWSSTRTGKQ